MGKTMKNFSKIFLATIFFLNTTCLYSEKIATLEENSHGKKTTGISEKRKFTKGKKQVRLKKYSKEDEILVTKSSTLKSLIDQKNKLEREKKFLSRKLKRKADSKMSKRVKEIDIKLSSLNEQIYQAESENGTQKKIETQEEQETQVKYDSKKSKVKQKTKKTKK